MWLVTDRGFYSVVDKGDREGFVCVRGRVREDMGRLLELDCLRRYADDVIETTDSDYRYRVYVTREDWVTAVAEAIDYDNFKNIVARRLGDDRASVYGAVWNTLYGLQS
jgi:hypothetical protein